ncbi:hypothetical protein [Glycomyces arizonensis]|uniref:hypothetical protein n=1 Tax=Glycomyces arizonensis TaxID=256035 RepID=UPI00041180C0|nr:hypothetical protein [Glycomyces arizonensis]
MTDTTTIAVDWPARLRAARDAIAAARAVEAQTIRDAHGAGMPTTQIADALGVKNRGRITEIIAREPGEGERTELAPVVYLRGAGVGEAAWARVRSAMWRRGWATESNRTRAWHLARGGAEVIMCDFSARVGDDFVVVGPVQAKYRDDETELALELPGEREGRPYGTWRRSRPRCDDPAGSVSPGGGPAQVTDAEALARHVADALDGIDPGGW